MKIIKQNCKDLPCSSVRQFSIIKLTDTIQPSSKYQDFLTKTRKVISKGKKSKKNKAVGTTIPDFKLL